MVHTFSSKVLVDLQKFLSPIVVCRTTRDKFAKLVTACVYPDENSVNFQKLQTSFCKILSQNAIFRIVRDQVAKYMNCMFITGNIGE